MSDLRSAIEEVLELLGGATAANAELTMRAVSTYLLCREALLLRPEEALEIRSEDTNASDYPVPEELLPSRPLAYPGPPPTFSGLAYNCLVGALDTLLCAEVLPWVVLDFPVREARTLEFFRKMRRRCHDLLLELIRPAPGSLEHSPPGSGPSTDPEDNLTTAFERIDTTSVVYSVPTEVWDVYGDHALIVRLTLGAPLLNTGTARVPPIVLEILILDFTASELWCEISTAATLAMLGSALIPALTFVRPPPWHIRDFFAQEPEFRDLHYRMASARSTAILRTAAGRSFEFADADRTAIEDAVFTPAVFRGLTTLTISDLLRASTIARLRHLAPEALTSLSIELDERYDQLAAGEASLLAYRGRGIKLFADTTELRLVLAPHVSLSSSAPLALPNAQVNGFLAAAFSQPPVVKVGNGVVLV